VARFRKQRDKLVATSANHAYLGEGNESIAVVITAASVTVANQENTTIIQRIILHVMIVHLDYINQILANTHARYVQMVPISHNLLWRRAFNAHHAWFLDKNELAVECIVLASVTTARKGFTMT
jgi:hypothetical protein